MSGLLMYGGTASTGSVFGDLEPLPRSKAKKPQAAAPIPVESAVYSYIRAMRALGHKTVNTEQIAKALSLSVAEVNLASKKLKDKGVKTS